MHTNGIKLSPRVCYSKRSNNCPWGNFDYQTKQKRKNWLNDVAKKSFSRDNWSWMQMMQNVLLYVAHRVEKDFIYSVQKPRGLWFITVSAKIVGQIPSNFWKLFSSCLQVLNPLWLRFVHRSPSREQKEQQLVDTKLYAKREKWLVLVLHHWGLPVAYHSWDMINCGVQKQLARPLFQLQ